MNKKIALMAITGILALASCSQTATDTTAPSVTFSASPNPVTSGTSVTLSGTATDAAGVSSVTISPTNGGPSCTATVSSTGAFSCTVTAPAVTSSTTYNYTATAKDVNGNTSNAATASYTVNPVGGGVPIDPSTPTHTVTVNLTGVNGTNITVKDANGAIVAGYNSGQITNGGKITLPAGVYTITANDILGYNLKAPATVTVDLSTADASASFTYEKATSANPSGVGAYYVDGSGNRVYLNFADGFDASKFRFNAWLEDEVGGINTAPINAGTGNAGNASDPERLEYAPVNHQNIVASYMEYNDNGTWRPVVGGQVEMNILPEAGTAYPAIRFTAADDVNRTTAPMTGQDIHSNAFSSRSWTNASGAYETNPIFYPNASYPYYNVTGVTNPIVPGYSWAALMNSPEAVQAFPTGTDYLEAKVQVVGFVNGNEVGKQWVTKRFIPQAKIDIVKELRAIDPLTRQCTATLVKDGSQTYLPGQEACFTITIRNTGDAVARSIAFNETWTPVKKDTYSIGMTPEEYTRLTAAGVTFNTTVKNDGQQYKFVDEKFSGTIASLAPGAEQTITFFGRGVNNGVYCDEASLGNYLNNPDPVTGAYRLVPNYGQRVDQACFTVYGQPELNITKTITPVDNSPVDPGVTANRNQWVDVTVTVRNEGTQVANNVLVSDRLTSFASYDGSAVPTDANHELSLGGSVQGMADLVAAQGNDGLDFRIPNLEAGGVLTYTYRARANADGTYCDTASITSVAGTPVTDRNSNACFTVAMAHLKIAKTNDPQTGLLPGDYYTSNIVVKNIGTLSAYEVNVFDLVGLGERTGARVQLVNGRYIITTDEDLPIGGTTDWETTIAQPRGVAAYNTIIGTGNNRNVNTGAVPINPVVVDPTQAPYTDPIQPDSSLGVVTIPPVVAEQLGVGQTAPGTDGLPHGVVIPAGGTLTLTVVSRIPAEAPIDNYCDIAVVTANNSNLVSEINRARACTTIQHILAVQTTLDDANDPISKTPGTSLPSSTLFTGSFHNEYQSTEGATSNLMTFTVGRGETTASNLIPANFRVYFDPTAEIDGTGQIVFNSASPDFVEITSSSTISAYNTATGVFTVNPNRVIPVGGVVFVTYTATAGAGAVSNTSYNSSVVWTSKGAISGVDKTDTAAEDTTVR